MDSDSQYAALLAMILEPTPRWSSFGPMADWLEEHGQTDLAFAYRWCIAKKAKPYPPRDGDYGIWLLGAIETESSTDVAKGLYGNRVYSDWTSRRNKANCSTFEQAMMLLAGVLREFRESM